MRKNIITLIAALAAVPCALYGQQTLTLEQCRQMAIEGNNSLKESRQQVEMAGYDRKIAAANYFPKVKAVGAYMYNGDDIRLIGDDTADILSNAGTLTQQQISGKLGEMLQNPDIIGIIQQNPSLLKILGQLQGINIAAPINAIGQEICNALTLDMQNTTLGAVTVQQPIFAGGKILASNQMAKLAEELARTQYSAKESEIAVDIEQAYWQIVAIASKLKLSESYAELLHKMERDVEGLIEQGFATPSDALSIKVKANEADMLLVKATNGLSLSKMLLCQKIGLPLDSEITLADEGLDRIPDAGITPELSAEDIYAQRNEIKSLTLANEIYKKKTDIARADMMPTVALAGAYYVTNPNLYHGFRNEFAGNYSVGVMVSIPIFHGTEALQKTRKAKAEQVLYSIRLDDARQMVSLQVAQLRKQYDEGLTKLAMTESNLANAEENLRIANASWKEGMTDSNVALQAQTAWLQAHSDFIEAGIELRMTSVKLAQAEGRI